MAEQLAVEQPLLPAQDQVQTLPLLPPVTAEGVPAAQRLVVGRADTTVSLVEPQAPLTGVEGAAFVGAEQLTGDKCSEGAPFVFAEGAACVFT
jgi:hypothetical protein